MPQKKTFLITGASSGLGLATARALDQAGAQVINASRTPGPIGRHCYLDLADLASIRSLVEAVADIPIDCVINNAGVMNPKESQVHNTEAHLGINFLGHFALTKFLCDGHESPKRFVHLTSMAARFVRFQEDLTDQGLRPYARSKLASLMFTLELSERDHLRTHIACHPGYSATNIQASLRLGKIGNALLAQSADQGALSILEAASTELPSGSYLGPKNLLGMRGTPQQLSPYKNALDPTARAALWQLAEQRLNLQFVP